MSYINRDIDKKISQWYSGNERSLMILGARQIGKTESIKQFFRTNFGITDDNLLPIIDLEKTPNVKNELLKGQSDGGKSFIRNLFISAGNFADLDNIKVVAIDEIQALAISQKPRSQEEIKTALIRLLQDDEFKFIFSGSLLGAKISSLEDFTKDLPGGIIHTHMFPISFSEFVEHSDGNREKIEEVKKEIFIKNEISSELHIYFLEKFGEYSFVGGMPRAELTFFEKGGSVDESIDSMLSLKEDYINDTKKYYQDELKIDAGEKIFEWLLFKMTENDKKKIMKKLTQQNPEKILYQFIVDSDIGLLVSHSDEYQKPLDQQLCPKTYFNDVGFLRVLIKDKLSGKEYDDLDKDLKKYASKDNLDKQLEDYKKHINHNGGCTFPGAGPIFEQVIAQSIKVNSYNYAYKFYKNPPSELEFILTDDSSAIEVKSGSFRDYPSSLDYAEKGNKVYFLTMMPYIGTSRKNQNFILLPVYSLCLLKPEELSSIEFKVIEEDVDGVLDEGQLPKTTGFYIEKNEEKIQR